MYVLESPLPAFWRELVLDVSFAFSPRRTPNVCHPLMTSTGGPDLLYEMVNAEKKLR